MPPLVTGFGELWFELDYRQLFPTIFTMLLPSVSMGGEVRGKEKKIQKLDENVSLRIKFSFLRDLKSSANYETVVFKVGFRLILLTTSLLKFKNF